MELRESEARRVAAGLDDPERVRTIAWTRDGKRKDAAGRFVARCDGCGQLVDLDDLIAEVEPRDLTLRPCGYAPGDFTVVACVAAERVRCAACVAAGREPERGAVQ